MGNLIDITSAQASELGENVHLSDVGMDFYDYEGVKQASLDFDGDYRVYFRHFPVDTGMPLWLALKLFSMGFNNFLAY